MLSVFFNVFSSSKSINVTPFRIICMLFSHYMLNFLGYKRGCYNYRMQFLQFLSLLQKRGLSYAIYEISFSSPKTGTIICNFWNFFIFSKNVDYHMQFMNFLPLLQKRGLSYAIS